MVLSIIFLTLTAVIKNAYVCHDQVTGNMILEGTLEKIRYCQEGEKTISGLIMEGERQGNPRLWLGEYQIEVDETVENVTGKAKAGAWSKEIEMTKFLPAQFLRRYQALMKIGEWMNQDGS